jgi:hypothetical protein
MEQCLFKIDNKRNFLIPPRLYYRAAYFRGVGRPTKTKVGLNGESKLGAIYHVYVEVPK